MNAVPIPELLAALVVSVVAIAIRFAWRAGRARWGTHRELATQRPIGDHEPERIRARLVASCVLLVIISVPLILRLVPPNGMYGFRTGATRSTPAIWYQANAFSGWALSIAAIVSAAWLIVLPATAKRWILWAVFFGPVAAAVILSFAYLRTL
jgi:SdpI/YhfL family protein